MPTSAAFSSGFRFTFWRLRQSRSSLLGANGSLRRNDHRLTRCLALGLAAGDSLGQVDHQFEHGSWHLGEEPYQSFNQGQDAPTFSSRASHS